MEDVRYCEVKVYRQPCGGILSVLEGDTIGLWRGSDERRVGCSCMSGCAPCPYHTKP